MTEATTTPLTVAPADAVAEVVFDESMEQEIAAICRRYPETKQGAALLPVLWLCQENWGWISPGIMRAIGERLELAPAFVEGVVTFYTMYQRRPPGRYLLQVCTTLSCQLCGTPSLVEHLKKKLGIGFGETTPDGNFTLVDVQCLGACGEAPVLQINNDYYTDLNPEKLGALLDGLAAQ
jgi:NADH-quinone oxidoreductase subunit E